MRRPIFVSRQTDAERCAVEAGLLSSRAFTLRGCQIVCASANRVLIPHRQIAHNLACNQQTVRNAIHDFNTEGTIALTKSSSQVHTIYHALDAASPEHLRDVLHRSPHDFGYPTSLCTLDLAAKEAFRQRLTDHEVTGETIRATLVRFGVRWPGANEWRDRSGQWHSGPGEEMGPT